MLTAADCGAVALVAPVVAVDDLEIAYFVLPMIVWALTIVALLGQAKH